MNALRCLRFARQPGPDSWLLVLLPGAYAAPEDAVQAGFVAACERAHASFELALPELPVGDLRERSGITALHEQIVLPGLAAGRRLCLAGISLGGYLALLYAQRYREHLGRLALIAPYLGNRGLSQAIESAGGAAAWLRAPLRPHPAIGSDEERGLWQFLQQPRDLPVLLGYGSEDRFSHSHRLAAGLLAPAQVCVVPGAHDWDTWLRIWEHQLRCLPQ